MKSVKYAAALVALGFASQAQATKYAYCFVNWGPQMHGTRYISGIIEMAEESAVYDLKYGPFGQGFVQHVQSVYDSTVGRNGLDCEASGTLKDANFWAFESQISGDPTRVRTGWLGGRPAAVDRKDPPRVDPDTVIFTLPGQKVTPPSPRTDSAPAKQQWEIDYEYKLAKYNEELAKQQQAVAEYERAKAETEARRAEAAERARKAQADYERDVARCKAEGKCAVTRQ